MLSESRVEACILRHACCAARCSSWVSRGTGVLGQVSGSKSAQRNIHPHSPDWISAHPGVTNGGRFPCAHRNSQSRISANLHSSQWRICGRERFGEEEIEDMAGSGSAWSTGAPRGALPCGTPDLPRWQPPIGCAYPAIVLRILSE